MGKKANVLILFSDQQRYDTINYAGYSHMITPNLDRLASGGCTYINAHSTNPVCMPARHDLLTGLPGRAHGYYGNHDVPIRDYGLPTLPRIFSENGYRTAAVGKMHFYPARVHHGYNEMFLMEELPVNRQDDQYATWLEKEGLGNIQNLHGVRPHVYHVPQTAQTDERHHGSTWVADKTIEWLEGNKDKPFFLFASWIHPHPPWNIPQEIKGIYKDRELPDPIPRSRCCLDCQDKDEWFGDNETEEEIRKIREAYYTAVTLVDKNIGRVLDYLDKKRILDDTLVIFASDHGEMLKDKGYYSKATAYDGSVRIPFIIRYPEKFGKGELKNEFVDLFDIMPTCLEVCGLKYNGNKYQLIGGSLCSDNPIRDRTIQISSFGAGDRRWVMCRNQRYKYIYHYNQGIEELYEMLEDPGELNNLIRTGTYPYEVYIQLKKNAIEYEKSWGPEDSIKDNDFFVIPGMQFGNTGSENNKFHFWANMQMQYFDERSNNERGEEFIKEIEHALSDHDLSVVGLDEVMNDDEWKQNFMENWRRFGDGGEICKKLFK